MKTSCKKNNRLTLAQSETLTKLRQQGPLQTTKLISNQKPVNFGLFEGREHADQISMF